MVLVKAKFPADFIWGTATASYRFEGAVFADGRGESIWDRLCRMPGRVKRRPGGHRPRPLSPLRRGCGDREGARREFLSLLYCVAAGFSPRGKRKANPKGLDFYKRLLDELEAAGIRPMATLYHWDPPQALQEECGGWVSRDVAFYFRDYAAYVFEQIGDRLGWVVTINEPWVAAMLGYGFGTHAPGIRDFKAALQAGHYLLYGHGLTVQVFREIGLPGQVGPALNLTPYYPHRDAPEDLAVARRMDGITNRWYLDAVLRGQYPEDVAEWYAERKVLPDLPREDLTVISQPIDFLGINYYTRELWVTVMRTRVGSKNILQKGPLRI